MAGESGGAPGGFRVPLLGFLAGGVFLAALVVMTPVFIWFFCRIEPGADQIAILIRKSGANLPDGQIIAVEPGQKGIQLDVLPEGRYFYNPYTWSWRISKVIDIPAGRLGVVTRLFGKDLVSSEIMAKEGTKGMLPEVLRPGKYRLNPFAYSVQLFDATSIRPGCVGVVTQLTGNDVLSTPMAADEANTFLVKKDMKGVVQDVLDPGTYYLHPYMYSVAEVNLQSQRFEMSDEDVITFLTVDGFVVTVEGTIEYSLQREQSALLAHRVGDMDDIIKKIILPRARGFSRLEGSKHPAIDFIVGETRQRFQNELETHLREKSLDWGVTINSVLISKIIVPDAIASISRQREMAVQDAKKFEQQIEQAKSQAELVKQETLAKQSQEKVVADTARIRAVISAEQEQAVMLTSAQKELEVARLRRDTAMFQADAVRLRAEGERDSIGKVNEAEAAVIESQVKALGSGLNLARCLFYEKIAPKVQTILSDDSQSGLGAILRPFLPVSKEGSK